MRMQIKNRLKINTIISVFMVLGIGVIQTYLSLQEERFLMTNRHISLVSQGIFNLNLLTNDYLFDQRDHGKQQWIRLYQEIDGELKELSLNEHMFQTNLQEITKNYEKLQKTFNQLTHHIENPNTSEVIMQDIHSRLIGQLLSTSQIIIADFQLLAQNSEQALLEIKAMYTWWMVGIIGLVAVFVILNSFFLNRLILIPINALRHGVQRIEQGDLAYRIPISKHNELGELSQAFNQMTESLQHTRKELVLRNQELEAKERSLNQARDLLETKVKERTQELATTNTQLSEKIRELKLLATAIDQAVESIIITDANGNIDFVNPAFESTTGYSFKEVMGKNLGLFKSGVEESDPYQNMREAFTEGNVWKGRLINKKKDNTLYEEEVSLSPIHNEQGDITHYVAVQDDVTYASQLEKQVRQSHKIQAVGILAGGIAHEFNNLLVPIIGFSNRVQNSLETSSKEYDYLERVLRAARHARDLIKQMLLFSHSTEGQLQKINIAPLIKEMLKLYQNTLPTSIQLTVNVNLDVPEIMADPGQVHELLMNLCRNAKGAIEVTGKISVSLKEVNVAELIDFKGQLLTGTYLCLTVKDTGKGMSAATLERIFEPFFTDKPQGQGTGLGLATVLGVVEKHHGGLTVASTLGHGTVFHIYLPVFNHAKTYTPAPQTQVGFNREPISI